MLLFIDESGHDNSGTPCEVLAGIAVAEDDLWNLVHGLLQQMAAYFLGTETGRYRSSRIVPEPFFVHSDLTTGVFLADLTAYILAWGWRQSNMPQPAREELGSFVTKLRDMEFHGQKPKEDDSGVWQLHGIRYIDDLRGHGEKEIKDV